MTHEEKLRLLRQWDVNHALLDKHWSALAELTGADPDCPLGEAVWDTFSDYTRTLGMLLDHNEDWLFWHWLENRMGDRGHQAGYNGQLREINTLEDLLWLIEEASK